MVKFVSPALFTGPFLERNVEVHDDGFLTAPHKHALERLIAISINFLMRYERGHEDEVAGPGFGNELQPFAPAHARAAAHDVDHAFQFTVMVGARLCAGVDRDRPSP